MRFLIISAALAVAVLAAPASSLALPRSQSVLNAAASPVTPAAYYYRRHYRHGGWVPRRLRGFEDPGYAYHGNINGCAVDLGYGRWESCNVGR
ncbi:MAG TPA: hypothetical protein VGX95_11535 [Xanthobacteraceae bacterium]|jgi:hypothetical protein|nr:hypothetical protein [Xanthobacteraceae bacterium]